MLRHEDFFGNGGVQQKTRVWLLIFVLLTGLVIEENQLPMPPQTQPKVQLPASTAIKMAFQTAWNALVSSVVCRSQSSTAHLKRPTWITPLTLSAGAMARRPRRRPPIVLLWSMVGLPRPKIVKLSCGRKIIMAYPPIRESSSFVSHANQAAALYQDI